MKTTIIHRVLLGSLLLSSVSFFAACDDDDDEPLAANTVVNVAVGNGFSTLAGALTSANLVTTLNGTGPFTVFAPTNQAFSGVTVPSNQAQLTSLLTYHVLSGTVRAADVPSPANGLTVGVATLSGDSVYVKRTAAGAVFINGVRVSRADLTATNGVVHELGTVLNRPTGNIVAFAVASGFDSLVKAVTYVSSGAGSENLAGALSNTQGLTVFAPTNAAFTALLPVLGVTSIEAIPKATLINVLKYHVLGLRGFSSDLADNLQLPTLLGATKSLTFTVTGGARVLGEGNGGTSSNIVSANNMATNGVIHAIDRVLRPL